MFRKLVSNLSFSPALVGQLGFYARRLRREQATRRLGLLFTAMALVVQSFAVFQPPEQAIAASPSNIIYGGVQTVEDVLRVYDNKTHDLKDLMDYTGITREEIASMDRKVQYVCSTDKSIISFGRQHRFSSAEGEQKHVVPSSNKPGAYSTFFSVPLYRFDEVNNRTNCYDSFVGHSKKLGWFSIMRKCGNLQIKKNVNPQPQGKFVKATCDVIQGFAYDERQLDLKVNVLLYLGGPPGKGKKVGPIAANQASPTSPAGSGHGFSYDVPEEYKTKTDATEVWAVLIPLNGWNASTVQFQNTVKIPGNCVKPVEKCPVPGKEHLPKNSPDCVTPVATCTGLQVAVIERTKFRLAATATASGGTKIQAYSYVVTDKSGKKVYEKTVTSDKESSTTEVFDIAQDGEYKASVVVKTTIGDKTSETLCAQPLQVAKQAMCKFNPSLPEGHPDCQPCPYDSTIWIKDAECVPKITQSKEARNNTQNIANANGTTANPSDRIEYTIYTGNESGAPVTTTIEEELTDILEYATLIDAGGGVVKDVQDSANGPVRKLLVWENVTITPGETEVRKIVVKINDFIPATPQAGGDPSSFNCVITNSYGNTINVNMKCPPPKAVEGAVSELPKTGPGENMLFAGVVLALVTYFYARSRQMNKEVKLIRREFNHETI